MSRFLDIALPLAERGFRIFPLIPKTKRPVRIEGEYDHFDVASTDLLQIRAWSTQEPDANVGISPDEIFCFLETDDEAALKVACADLPPEVWDTARVSARENRCYYIFRQTMRTKRAGNMTAAREGQENLFEFKQHRMYVTGPGSIHPKTGTPYQVKWQGIPALPDVLLNRLCELYGEPKATSSGEMSEVVKEQTALLDSFLTRYEVATTGDWFNKGKQWYRPIVCPWKDSHENQNEGTSTCIVYTEDGGYGFDCKHRCSSKEWKEFRAELAARFPERKFSFAREDAIAVISLVEVVEEAEYEPERPDPVYPIEEWDGTEFGEFANVCAEDNNVPRKLYLEAFRTVTGAVVGDRIQCQIEGVEPRTYTILPAPPGKGKGSSIGRATSFYEQTSLSGMIVTSPLLFGPGQDSWKAQGIGAEIALPSSMPGLMRIITPPKPKAEPKKAKGKGGVEVSIEKVTNWEPMARVVTAAEELKELFANLYTENGVGTALEGGICRLWDSTTFSASTSNERQGMSSKVMYTILGGITPEDWTDLLSRGSSVGSGFMSRLNIIGTRGEWENVEEMQRPDFIALRRRFLPRIYALKDNAVMVGRTEGAAGLVREWFRGLKSAERSHSRFNLHAWRSALWLAWLRGHPDITEKDALGGIRLAQYQWDTRDYYTVTRVENPVAKVQEKIRKALREAKARRLTLNELKRVTHADRVGTEIWMRALDGMIKSGEVAQEGGKRVDSVVLRLLKMN